jgi:predicted nucleic acid-binding protein
LAEKKRVYWDACIWFALIKQEPGRFHRCQHVIDMARRGEVEIWTSALTLAEVFRKQCGGPEATSLPADKDEEFEDFLAQDFVFEVQLDRLIGVSARRLLRAHAALKKPQDAVHLASAVWNDLDEFHTFDAANLLCLNGSISTRGGRPLRICEPPEPPTDLFSSLTPIEEAAAGPAAVEQLAAVLPPAELVASPQPEAPAPAPTIAKPVALLPSVKPAE